jgi:hypothetical protein
VRYSSTFYYDLPEGKTKDDFDLNSPVSYSFSEYKDDIETALINKFGQDNIERNDKCITVKGNKSGKKIKTTTMSNSLLIIIIILNYKN